MTHVVGKMSSVMGQLMEQRTLALMAKQHDINEPQAAQRLSIPQVDSPGQHKMRQRCTEVPTCAEASL